MEFKQIITKTDEVIKQFPIQFDKRDILIHMMEEVGALSENLLLVEKRKVSNDPTKQKTVADVSKKLCSVLMYMIMLAQKYELDLEADYLAMLSKMEARIKQGEFNK